MLSSYRRPQELADAPFGPPQGAAHEGQRIAPSRSTRRLPRVTRPRPPPAQARGLAGCTREAGLC